MVILSCTSQDKEAAAAPPVAPPVPASPVAPVAVTPPASFSDFANLSRYQAANAALAESSGDRVVFLGNSITDAWASVDSSFFTSNDFVGRGISGQTSPQLLVRFPQDVLGLNPKTVVIHIGTNDIAENTGPYDQASTVNNIESMVNLAEKNGIEAVIASVLPATQFSWRPELGDKSEIIVQLNEQLQGLATDRGLKYIDYHSALKNAANGMDVDLAEDGVHPTVKGYEIMKRLALEALR